MRHPFSRFGQRLAARFWSPERSRRRAESFWMAHPAVRAYINRSVTGREGVWPIEWLAEVCTGESRRRGLVPGCGTGALERDLLAKGICSTLEAFDPSVSAVEQARRLAEQAGLADRIRYSVASFEEYRPKESSFDAVFFHHSLHHLASPRDALRRVRSWLVDGGLLYVDEYVGPSRRHWNRNRFAPACFVYENLIPRELRSRRRLAVPGLLAKLADPSEAIASDSIPAAVRGDFEVRISRDYGGFLLQPLWTQIVHEGELIASLILLEEALLRLVPSWFTVMVCRRPFGG